MPIGSDRASAILLLVACALVGHLLMLTNVGAPAAQQHSEMSAAAADAGMRQTDPADPFSHEGSPSTEHAMAVTCLAVLAASGLIYGAAPRLALRGGAPAPGTGGDVSTWRRLRDLWPPPRTDQFRIGGGALLLI